MELRNPNMIAQIEGAPVAYPFTFTLLGDTAAGPTPVGDLIFAQMLRQMAQLTPTPRFMVNLGDFAGPGLLPRHEHYLQMVEGVPFPNLCLSGNHDCDDPTGFDVFQQVHGAHNFTFSYGNVGFVCINGHGGKHIPGPQANDIAFLEKALAAAPHPTKIVMLHMPPNFNDRYAPHPDWGFKQFEVEFLRIVKAYGVKLVCSAHVIAFDQHIHDGVQYVVSGGGGWGLCTHYGHCVGAWDLGHPPHTGAFYHFVEITVGADGTISGLVYMACEGTTPDHRYGFGPRFRALIAPTRP